MFLFVFLLTNTVALTQFARYKLAKQRYQRMVVARKMFNEFVQYKTSSFIDQIARDYSVYTDQLNEMAVKDHVEYNELPLFQWPTQMVRSGVLVSQDSLQEQLVQMFRGINQILIMINFPESYWHEKVARYEADKLFSGQKPSWGEHRREWKGNYLLDMVESPYYLQFQLMFRIYKAEVEPIRFACYIVKNDNSNDSRVQALVMNDHAIYFVDLANFSLNFWASIKDLTGIVVTPGPDQLIVLHTNNAYQNDLVFSLVNIKEPGRLMADMAIAGNAMMDHAWNVRNFKIGEFVAILHLLYKQ